MGLIEIRPPDWASWTFPFTRKAKRVYSLGAKNLLEFCIVIGGHISMQNYSTALRVGILFPQWGKLCKTSPLGRLHQFSHLVKPAGKIITEIRLVVSSSLACPYLSNALGLGLSQWQTVESSIICTPMLHRHRSRLLTWSYIQSIWIAKNPDGYHKLSTNKACADQLYNKCQLRLSTIVPWQLSH